MNYSHRSKFKACRNYSQWALSFHAPRSQAPAPPPAWFLFTDKVRDSASTCMLCSSFLSCRRLPRVRIALHCPLALNTTSRRPFCVSTEVFPASPHAVTWDSVCGLFPLQLGSFPGAGFAAENGPVRVLLKCVWEQPEGGFLTGWLLDPSAQRLTLWSILPSQRIDVMRSLSVITRTPPGALADVGKLPVWQ